ncbi:MAG TPA: response regulator [Azospira sp.]|nr:response regulator [Azospira sp.]
MTPAKSILIADDEARNRKLIETLLRAAGYQVRSADSGRGALDAIAAEPPDLILLDLMMPGMDGFEVVRRLKADPATRTIPVAMVTALDDEASHARLRAVGISEVIHKPIDRWALQACVDRLLGKDDGQP